MASAHTCPTEPTQDGTDTRKRINDVVLGLGAWLDTMRGPDGYGGPVVHWWQDSLLFTGAGLDWRYEGIICGYLSLYEGSGEARWLEKACQAGDDLLRGQLPTGNFRNSSFEINPLPGGTPHEAACDAALLALARVLKRLGRPTWGQYAAAAEHNLREFVIGVLWDDAQRLLRNTAFLGSFVPNKAATTAEALFAWAELSGDDALLERYVRPILDALMDCQTRAPGRPVDGGICQSRDGQRRNERYFPFYVARCIPALVQGHKVFTEARFLAAARTAGAFIRRHKLPDGSFPQIVYGDGHIVRYPQWIAGAGDILRALDLLDDGAGQGDGGASLEWLLRGVQPSGALCTAHGFASQVSQRQPPLRPDFRDQLPVCGWADKAFRFLAGRAPAIVPGEAEATQRVEVPCQFRGREAVYCETAEYIEMRTGKETLYRWLKADGWAEVA
jgi:hypothetical protein